MADSTFTIFYSWQSDLPNSTTRGLIESSIEAAVRSLRNTVSVCVRACKGCKRGNVGYGSNVT